MLPVSATLTYRLPVGEANLALPDKAKTGANAGANHQSFCTIVREIRVMALSDIAEGLEITESQDEQGVATVDTTDATLAERLAPFEESLPCAAGEAATILERYAGGANVGTAGRAAGVAPISAAKTLHLLGESVTPVGPTGRDVIRDWIAGDLSRTEALELTRLGEREFALATYVETHDTLEEGCAAIEGVLAANRERADPLSDALGDTFDGF